jgi:aspartate racemase
MHIGVLAHSADGAALCFLEIVRESARRLGAHQHPEITLSILPMGPTLEKYRVGDLDGVNKHLGESAERLARAGCDFFVCPDNTAHIAFAVATKPFALPGLHIARIVAERAIEKGYRRIALLGTRWTMEGSAYRRAFDDAGLDLRTPAESERAFIDHVIFSQLCQGIVSEQSRGRFIEIISEMRSDGCDAVALSCTEIPLLVTPDVSPLPTLDSTRLLAHSAIDVALGQRPLPTWRGGPFV